MTQEEQDLQEKRIAADILIAAINTKSDHGVTGTRSKATAEKLAQAYKIIYKAISESQT